MANYNLREVLKQLGRNILSWVKSNCVNNCVSTTTNLPLAAAQGKVLQDQITAQNSNIDSCQKDWIKVTSMANVPSTAKEVKFIAYFESGTPIIFENEFLYSSFTTSNRSFQLGGYYASSNNYVACYVTATQTTSVLSGLGAVAGLQKALIIYYR